MHRVSALLSWDKRKSHKASGSLGQLSAPAPKVGREAFWPGTLDSECEKAARILKSFCTDGCVAPLEDDDPNATPPEEPRTPVRIVQRIPKRIIQNAAGIAIFTCMRSGLWMTGSGGSGILIARKADGTWSPPSALLLHTPTLSFIIGVDIYDCVLIINNLSALESLMKPSTTLGEDVGLMSGPMVPHGSMEAHIRWKDLGNTVLTYLKARGQSQPVNLNGCILTERGNENERFYSGNISVEDVLAGNVSRNVEETRPLFEVIKQAEGRTDFDATVVDQIAVQCAPGDAMIESPKSTPVSPRSGGFGIPDTDDPDPFGVLALEMAGLEIREAGTRLRPTSHQFEFSPCPTSPVYSHSHKRQSAETFASRSNRGSCLSVRTQQTHTTDACTQTDTSNTPHTTPSLTYSEDGRDRASFERTKEMDEVDYTKIDFSPIRQLSDGNMQSLDGATIVDGVPSTDDDRHTENETENEASHDEVEISTPATSIPSELDEDDGVDADDEDDEEPVIYEVAAAVQPVMTAMVTKQVLKAKCSLVNIPKRVPPPLPLRSPARASRASKSELGDVSMLKSPLRQSFNTGNQTESVDATVHKQETEQEARLGLAAEIIPNKETASHKHAGSMESVESTTSSVATPTAAVTPTVTAATKEEKIEVDEQKKMEMVQEAEAVTVEAPAMTTSTIAVV